MQTSKFVLSLLVLCISDPIYEAQAVKLRQMSFNNLKVYGNSDEIDPDDQELTDGPLKNEGDVAVYAQSFINKGENVSKLNDKMAKDKQAKIDAQNGIIDDIKVSTPNLEKQFTQDSSQQRKNTSLIQDASSQKKEQKQENEKKEAKKEETMSEEERQNTEQWAKVGATPKASPFYQPKPAQHDLVGEIETKQMDMKEKSEIMHAVVKGAQIDEAESRNPSSVRKMTADQVDSERKEEAEELDTQVMDLERMKFSAKDLNDFSSMTQKNAGATFDERNAEVLKNQAAEKVEAKKDESKKNFYEQILDKKKAEEKK